MSATITMRVYTGGTATSESTQVTAIDLCSADTATSSLTNRQNNPITVGERSYEKWMKGNMDHPPDNYCNNFQIWKDAAVQASTTLYVGSTYTGAAPASTTSSVATTDFDTQTAGNKLVWYQGTLSATGDETDYVVLQLLVNPSASAGNWTQETISWSFDEA